jgi:hypothetical protein
MAGALRGWCLSALLLFWGVDGFAVAGPASLELVRSLEDLVGGTGADTARTTVGVAAPSRLRSSEDAKPTTPA